MGKKKRKHPILKRNDIENIKKLEKLRQRNPFYWIQKGIEILIEKSKKKRNK